MNLGIWDSTVALTETEPAHTIVMDGCSDCSIGCAVPQMPRGLPAEPGGEDEPLVLLVFASPQVTDSTVTWCLERVRRHTKAAILIDYAVRGNKARGDITEPQVAKCRKYLARVFADFKPGVVITFDNPAATAVYGKGAPVHNTPRLRTVVDGVRFGFCGNPSLARSCPRFYGKDLEETIEAAFEQPTTKPADIQYEVITPDTADFFELWLEDAPHIFFDTETYSQPFNEDYDVDIIAFWYIGSDLAWSTTKERMRDPAVFAVVKKALETKDVSGQNLAFDLVAVEAAFGIRPELILGDAMALYKLHDVERSAALPAQALQLGIAGFKDEAHAYVKEEKKRLNKQFKAAGKDPKRSRTGSLAYRAIPPDISMRYAARDAVTSGLSWQDTASRIHPVSWDTHERLVRHAPRFLADMQLIGIKVDRQRFSSVAAHIKSAVDTSMRSLAKVFGGTIPFDPDSSDQVRDYLESQGVDTGVLTATEKMSVSAKALKRLHDHEVVAPLLEYRGIAKLMNTYIEGLPYDIRDDGRIHCSYRLSGARSGRLSTTGPSVHQVPSRSELGKLIKSLFVPDPGFTMICADYKTLEVVIAANYAQDPTLIETIANGGDIHLQTAQRIGKTAWGLDPDELLARHLAGKTMYRTAAKTVVFGILYGQGPQALAEAIRSSKDQAIAIMRAFEKAHPELMQAVMDAKRKASITGEMWSLWGHDRIQARRRRLADIGLPQRDWRHAKAGRVAFNHPIQSWASDICLTAGIELHGEWRGTNRYMLGTVHDSLLAQCPHDEVDATCAQMVEVMTRQPTSPLPLRVDVEVGSSWGQVKEWVPKGLTHNDGASRVHTN